MERSEQINELVTSLVKAQSVFKNIIKDNDATINTKAGKSYTYSYADLGSLLDMVRAPLSANGLCVVQSANTFESSIIIETMLFHTSGQWLKNSFKLPIIETGNNAIQAIGSSITYGRRYELSSMLGIASELDDDANAVPSKKPAYVPPNIYSDSSKEQQSLIPEHLTLRGMLNKIAAEKFGDLDKFKAWRVHNNLPEDIDSLTDFNIAKIMTAVREYKKEG